MSQYKQVFVDMESEGYRLGWENFKLDEILGPCDVPKHLTDSERRDYIQAQKDAAYYFADKQGVPADFSEDGRRIA